MSAAIVTYLHIMKKIKVKIKFTVKIKTIFKLNLCQ